MFSTYNSIVQLTISSPTLSLYSVPLIRTPMGGSDVGSADHWLGRRDGVQTGLTRAVGPRGGKCE